MWQISGMCGRGVCGKYHVWCGVWQISGLCGWGVRQISCMVGVVGACGKYQVCVVGCE